MAFEVMEPETKPTTGGFEVMEPEDQSGSTAVSGAGFEVMEPEQSATGSGFEPMAPDVPAEATLELRKKAVADAEARKGSPLTVEERAQIYQADAAARGDTARAVNFSRMRAGVDNAARDVETAQAKEAAVRMPYLEARGALGGLTMGISDVALAKAEEAAGGRVRAESTLESLGESAGRLAGGVATGLKLAPAVSKGAGRIGLAGASNMLATRLATTGIQAGLSSAAQVATGDQSIAGAAKDVAQSLGAALVGVVPENWVKPGARNWVAQVLTNVGYDLVTDGVIRDRIKDQGFVNWLVTQELPQLTASVVFATRDLTDKNFASQQQVARYQIKNAVRTAIEAPELRARGVPDEVIGAMRGARNEAERQHAFRRWIVDQGAEKRAEIEAALPTMTGAAPTEAMTRDKLRALTNDRDVQGAVHGLLQELDAARDRTMSGGTGLNRREGNTGDQGWFSQGRAYPEGMDGTTGPLIERWMAGEDLTDKQLQVVADAVEYARARLSEQTGYEIGKQRPVVQGELKAGDAFTENGKTVRVTSVDEDGGLTLTSEDGSTRRLMPGDQVHVDTGTWKDGTGANVDGMARAAEHERGANADAWEDPFAADASGPERMDDGRWVIHGENGPEEIDTTTEAGKALVSHLEERHAVRNAVDEAAAKLPGAKVHPVESEDQLPANVQATLRQRKMNGGNLGVWDEATGEVWIVTGNHTTPEEAQRTVLHEVVGHKGLRAVLGERLTGVLDGIFKARSADAEMGKIASEYKLDLSTSEGRQEAAEELVARVAGRRTKEPGPWRRLIANLKEMIRKAGWDLKWTDGDIEALVDRAARRMSKAGDTEISSVVRRQKTDSVVPVQKVEPSVDENVPLEQRVPWLGPKQLRNAVRELMMHGLSVREVEDYLTGKTPAKEVQRYSPREAGEDWYSLLAEIEIRRDAYLHKPLKAFELEYYGTPPPAGYVRRGDVYVYEGSTGGAVRLATPQQGAAGKPKSTRDLIEEYKAAQKAAGLVPRRLNERMATRPGGIPEIMLRPESYRRPATMAEREQQHAQMSDADLMMGYQDEANNPWAALDGVELLNRLEERRRTAESAVKAAPDPAAKAQAKVAADAARNASMQFVDQIGTDATRWGRMLRWVQEIRGATPAGMVSIAKRMWSNLGYRVPEPIEQRLTGMADEVLQATQARKAAEQAMQQTMTDASITAYDEAMQAEHKAMGTWLREVTALTPKSGPDILKGFIQGNLIRGTTHQINVAANAVQVGLDFGADNLGAAAERLVKYAAAMAPGRVGAWGQQAPVAGARGLGGGLGKVITQGVPEIVTGLGPRDATEKWRADSGGSRSFAPIRAAKQLFSGMIKPDSLDMLVRESDGNVPAGDRFKKLVEWLGGAYPEANFRLLGLEDLAFREPRMNAVLREIGRRRGLKGNALEVFTRVPDAAARETAMTEALTSVYQGKNKLAQWAQHGRKLLQDLGPVGQWADAVVVTPTIPYVNTVTNLGIMGLKLSHPVYAMSTGLFHMSQAKRFGSRAAAAQARGNADEARVFANKRDQAERMAWRNGIGYAIVGGAMNVAAAAMYQAGLVEGSEPEDKNEKELMRRQGRRPATWNFTAFRRWVASGFDKEAAKPQEGDVWRTMLPLGFMGLNAVTVADRFKEYERNGLDPAQMAARDKVLQGVEMSLPFGARGLLNLPMMQASLELLQSIDRGNYNGLISSWLRGINAAWKPGMVDQAARAAQVAIPDTKHYQGWQQIKNFMAENNPWIDWATAFPVRRDPLGQPIWRTPAGAPFWMYNVVLADKPVPMVAQDPVWREIGSVFEKTTNVRAIPQYPERTWTAKIMEGPRKGQTVSVALDGQEYEDFVQEVGRVRMNLFRDVASGDEYKNSTPDEKARILDKAWSKGLDGAKKMWQERKRAENSDVVKRVSDAVAAKTTAPL